MIADSGLNLRPAETIRTLYVVYDGPGRMKNNHLVGYDAPNANFLQNAGAAKKRVNHYFEGLTFDPPKPVRSVMPNLDFIPPSNIDANGQAHPRVWGMVIVDVDGSIYGVPNSSIIGNHPFMLTGGETRPSEWTNTYRSDNRFAQCRLEYDVQHGSFPDVSVVRTKPGTPTRGVYYINGYNEWHQLPLIVRKDFLYTYSYPSLPSTRKVIVKFEDAEAGDHMVLRFKDFGKLGFLTVSGMTSYSSLVNLKAGSTSGFYRETNGDLYLRPVATAARHSYTIAWSSNGTYTPLILDSDGDGTSDGAEAAAGTDPFRTLLGTEPFLNTEFNVTGNFENWDSFIGIINDTVATGTLSARSSSTDPQMFSSNLRISGNAMPVLLVRYKASANGIAQFSWKKLNDTDFTTARSVSVNCNGNDQWQTLVFPMSSNAEWNNQVITDLRFDPVAAENVDFQIDYIRGSASAPISVSLVPDQTIALDSSTGQVAVTVGYGGNDPSPLQLTATSSNTALVPLSGIAFAGSGANRAITVTPAAFQFGSSVITISVSDGEFTTSSSFTVTVTPPTPTDRTWSGLGGDNNWSTAANWGGTAPSSYDPLFFAGSTRLSNNNNFATGTPFGSISFNAAAGAFILSGNRIALGGNISFSGNPSSGAITQTINLPMIISADRIVTTQTNGAIALGGMISGTGKLTKAADGTLTLLGANSHSGGTQLGLGTLNINHASALGSGLFTIAGASTLDNTTVADIINSQNNPLALNENLTFTGTRNLNLGNGNVTLNATRNITVAANTLTIGGVISDGGNGYGFLKFGTGTLALNGLNTYTGNVRIEGILSANTLADASAPSSLGAGTGIVQFGFGTRSGTLQYTGAQNSTTNRQMRIGHTVANASSQTGGGTIENNGTGALTFSNTDFNPTITGVTAPRTLILGGTNTGQNTISGIITNNASGNGRISLTKADAGTWVLAGANSYTGTTTVSAGTLLVNGNSSTANAAVAVNGTSTLGGSGTLGGTVTVAAGANLAPGASASVGTLTTLGSLNISASAGGTGKLIFGLGPINASDKIAVTGTLTIGSGVLGFSDFNFSALTGLETGTYTLITSNSISGTLDPDAADLTGTIGGSTGILRRNGTTIELVVSGAYQTWSGGAAFDADANNDGVKNGIAWLLGAANPNTNANGLLPTCAESGGGLVMNFRMLNAASRGGAEVRVQHTGDLGIFDPWCIPVTVPETNGIVGGISFTITPSGTMNQVNAIIPATESTGVGLFGRLNGVSVP